MLLCTLGATFLGKMLEDKPKLPRRGAIRTGKGVIWASEETIRGGQDFK